ncbi:hypothetical protein BWL13_00462 [Microbacterium oleivorans]|uniref:hypothetical protein n=1 Tax=Microbacterium oleivorans TaxID=273677 RepID=UPI000975C431|nr:hypothetical protein [Microbacterium oleivorans]AZS42921.1 hypothetical protein BWL13_00462 [Microbacterium oleivorans]
MARIDISYGGQRYSVGNRTLEELHREIRQGARDGQYWLAVNDGEGSVSPAYLFITPGVPIAVIPVPEPHDPPTEGNGTPFHESQPEGFAPLWNGPTIHPGRSPRL